jgi:putative endonuclease
LSVEIGRQAEDLAVEWLIHKNFTILNRNWRTRWCEVDVIAERSSSIHIIEVKYRRRPDFGTGFDYITFNKRERLKRAAQIWLHSHGQVNASYQIDVIAVNGVMKFENIEYLPNAISW